MNTDKDSKGFICVYLWLELDFIAASDGRGSRHGGPFRESGPQPQSNSTVPAPDLDLTS
jgi:hypothetical protein